MVAVALAPDELVGRVVPTLAKPVERVAPLLKGAWLDEFLGLEEITHSNSGVVMNIVPYHSLLKTHFSFTPFFWIDEAVFIGETSGSLCGKFIHNQQYTYMS